MKVEIIAATAATSASVMESNQADISATSGTRGATELLGGVKGKFTAGIMLPWDQYIIVSKASGATRPEELKGQTFGISGFGSAGHFATTKMADSLGWKTSDYEIAQLGDLQALLAGLQRGTIQAFVWNISQGLAVEKGGYGTMLGSVRDLVGPNVFEVFYATDKFISERPEALNAFYAGYYNAVKLLQADPAKAVDIMINQWKNDPEVAKTSVEQILPLLSIDGKIPVDNLHGLEGAAALTLKRDESGIDLVSQYRYWGDIK